MGHSSIDLLRRRISVMGGDQAANVLHLIELDKRRRESHAWSEEEQEAFKEKIRKRYDEEGSPWYASARLWDDGVIDPADSRTVLGLALSASVNNFTSMSSLSKKQARYGIFRM